MTRCPWPKNELAVRYHDEEWGRPVHDDRVLFESSSSSSTSRAMP